MAYCRLSHLATQRRRSMCLAPNLRKQDIQLVTPSMWAMEVRGSSDLWWMPSVSQRCEPHFRISVRPNTNGDFRRSGSVSRDRSLHIRLKSFFGDKLHALYLRSQWQLAFGYISLYCDLAMLIYLRSILVKWKIPNDIRNFLTVADLPLARLKFLSKRMCAPQAKARRRELHCQRHDLLHRPCESQPDARCGAKNCEGLRSRHRWPRSCPEARQKGQAGYARPTWPLLFTK